MPRNFNWSENNGKLKKTAKKWKERFGRKAKIISFNIPQLKSETGQKTCPYAGYCADICYAGQGRMALAPALAVRERNLALLNEMTPKQMRDAFSEDIESFRTVTHIRIHDSGDFFKRSYYQAWVKAAGEFPEIIFYAYTKSLPFLAWDSHPPNLRITQSIGGKRDKDIDEKRPHSRIFANDRDRKRVGYCDGNDSDIPAILGQRRIGLVYHGVKSLRIEDRHRLSIL